MEQPAHVPPDRREFLRLASLAGSRLALDAQASSRTVGPGDPPDAGQGGYKYRVAFGCWINDMRSEALPL